MAIYEKHLFEHEYEWEWEEFTPDLVRVSSTSSCLENVCSLIDIQSVPSTAHTSAHSADSVPSI